MNNANYPINQHQHYHAHVYFDQDTIEYARQLCQQASEKFNLEIGRVHQKPVGPHTQWSCQILFDHQIFEQLIPWLEQHRKQLSILVHAITGDDIIDHTDYAYWLGEAVNLDLSKL